MEGQSAGRTSVQMLQLGGGLPAAIYRPSLPGTRPAVLVAPGGLGRGDLEAYRWAGERLADAGYVALIATYSAESPYEDVADLRLALDTLESDAQVAPRRIGVLGHSRGGLAALRLAAVDARVRAVISIAAPVDLERYVVALAEFAPAAREGIIKFVGGEPADLPQRYESLRALSLASSIRVPVLLVHGTADMRVPLEHSQQMEHALREAGHQHVQVEMLPGVGHFLELGTLGYQFDAVGQLISAWLGKELG